MRSFHGASLLGLPQVRHGFFTCEGGVSTGLYNSLNTAFNTQDTSSAVAENRRRIQEKLGARFLVAPHQTHSATVIHVETPWSSDSAPEGDALVTTIPGIALAVQTADCVPVLLADRQGKAVAAIHAGWGGAVKGIVGLTIETMARLGVTSNEIVAAIGPCIRRESYEVSQDFPLPFLKKDPESRSFFFPAVRVGHLMFDLAGYVRSELEKGGVMSVVDVMQDTYTQPELFFSYRRATHRAEPDYGRQMSAIVLL